VVFLDIWLADRDGLETLQALREADPAAAVVMMSGHGTTSTAVKAIKMGAFDYLEKPLSYKRAWTLRRRPLLPARPPGGRSRRSTPGLPRDRAEAERRFTPRPPCRSSPTPAAGSAPSATPPWSTAWASTRASAPAWSSSRCRRTAASTS
jgi:CheY-like chemotaxis protein